MNDQTAKPGWLVEQVGELLAAAVEMRREVQAGGTATDHKLRCAQLLADIGQRGDQAVFAMCLLLAQAIRLAGGYDDLPPDVFVGVSQCQCGNCITDASTEARLWAARFTVAHINDQPDTCQALLNANMATGPAAYRGGIAALVRMAGEALLDAEPGPANLN